MINQQENNSFSTTSLKAEIALLQSNLADKDSVISKLTIDLEAARFQNDQMRRMIFGSSRERFVSNIDINQLRIEFEPKAAEISEAVKVERELIRVAYERRKVKKEHPGRMALPSHLPVVEIVIEPSEDTTGMVCIGQEITDELDYTPPKLHINRFIRPKYITKEDEKCEQRQVIAPLRRPIHKCIASAALLTMIFINKFIYHLPLYRTHKQIIQMGVPLPSSTLESWVKLAAGLIRPLYALHRMYVFRGIHPTNSIFSMRNDDPTFVENK